jgi:hypothetical protein
LVSALRMQAQTTHAATIAQKIQSCICCIAVFSAPNTTTSHYKQTDVSVLRSSSVLHRMSLLLRQSGHCSTCVDFCF